ncbi:MAG TPA: cobalamin-independent methionine synthase II family protein [Candidatus Acidoferrales bacterium]|jgi:5-methyltetrahydropteroyltriglutamate--homocysteine methyltransferase|nr:cobalamin-independent methionine synthase II family protein [Candidatus Acidoferrales bacterium]
MKRSANRILTTHVGSLVRPAKLLEFVRARESGGAFDQAAYKKCLRDSIAEVVRRQAAAGIDIVDDGEFGKSTSWSLYALKRLSGFEQRPVKPDANPFARGADRERFAEFYAELEKPNERTWSNVTTQDAVCVAPIEYTGLDELQRDIANFKAALAGVNVEEAFLPVAAPSSAIPDRKNEYYKTQEDLIVALAEALRTEYRAIVDAGLLLQVDDARAAVTYDRMVPPASFEDYYHWVARHVEILNHALEGIPEDRVRYHVCWGSWPGPHTTDVPLEKIVDLILKVRAGAYLIEAANPRHEHEWRVWQRVKLPEGKILAPGMISHSTNVVEHPELVAERILRFASVVGRENVIASTDCGFAQEQFNRRVHPSIMWAKLESLAQGARIASAELWGAKSRSEQFV